MNNPQKKPLVRIKGVKNGLHFLLDDCADWHDVIHELEYKLMKTHHMILSGPVTDIYVKLGTREITANVSQHIHEVIGFHENLKIKSIETSAPTFQPSNHRLPYMRIEQGMIRSGQTLQFDCDVLFLGDVNPGGAIKSSGNIYIMGSLRGNAHAGIDGNESAMIMASYFKPTQLRIAHLISRPPDEWGVEEFYMECAYIADGRMEIEKIQHLHKSHLTLFHTVLQTSNS